VQGPQSVARADHRFGGLGDLPRAIAVNRLFDLERASWNLRVFSASIG